MIAITFGIQLAKVQTARAAVVPYTIDVHNGTNILYFLFARDRVSGDITDLGGGVKKNEYSLIAALREFREESDEIFGTLYERVNDLTTNIALLGDNMSVLFIPVKWEWYKKAPDLFKEKKKSPHFQFKRSHNEVSELLWFNENEFQQLISPKNKQMWTRIRKFYQCGFDTNLKAALKMVYTCY
uniref:NUDIX hydrolase n=1 Tax=Marseillevirus LCMAC102 TaxID=2506603 RepID=A0A481YV27_9VIRU|nr:MAG: NUDIX hydrolase [Marseillevirus LCMAC102]